ncbi:MAG TPA: hydroxymethylbilane synthase [Kofleriaceae bacterium]|nr:hydroxymethylbilane synthase [Kofleriaceae bacterium]
MTPVRSKQRLTIATRGSALALWQAEHVKARLLAIEPELDISLLVLKTTGDKILDRPLSEVGGKGLFVKEIEQALLDGAADLAVHSMKDVPAELAPGLRMAAISAREDPRDALVSRGGEGLDRLAAGARVGTSSLRRVCQLRARRSDLVLVPLRGNVPTRLAAVERGALDAAVLAAAGLRRLGHEGRISELLDPSVCVPAGGQGALGVETRADDADAAERARRAVHSDEDAACVAAERGFTGRLGGGCQTPLAAHARPTGGGELHLVALIGRPDGTEIIRDERRGPASRATELGTDLAEELLARGGARILRDLGVAT